MKGKIRIIAKFHRTDLVICSHFRERKPPSYSQRNTVYMPHTHSPEFFFRGWRGVCFFGILRFKPVIPKQTVHTHSDQTSPKRYVPIH